MSKVLVTGGNGFIAAHILKLFVDRNDEVIVTVRSESSGQQILQRHNGAVQYCVVEDMTMKGSMDKVFLKHKDIEFVIHTASPFQQSWTDAIEDMLNPAVQGTLETLRSAKALATKLRRVVLLSSIVTLMKPGTESGVIDESMWNPVTWDGAVSNPRLTYVGSKTLAEKAAWEFLRDEKPGFDMVALNPPLVFGPIAHDLLSLEKINTSNLRILALVQGKLRGAPLPPTGVYTWVDVRDVALAHVRAIHCEAAGGERIAVVGGYFSNKKLADAIAAKHPDLEWKLPINAVDDGDANQFFYNATKASDVLNIKYRSFESCIDDTVTSLRKHGA